MASGLALSQIGQIAIDIHDLDRAVAFYRDVLGMKFLFQAPPKLAFFDCGGVRLMLTSPRTPSSTTPARILYYKVDDIQATWCRLSDHGADFREPPHLSPACPTTSSGWHSSATPRGTRWR